MGNSNLLSRNRYKFACKHCEITKISSLSNGAEISFFLDLKFFFRLFFFLLLLKLALFLICFQIFNKTCPRVLIKLVL